MINNSKRCRCSFSGFLLLIFVVHLSSAVDYGAAETRIEMAAGGGIIRLRRQLMSGPGSYPPCCVSKCGRCYPCTPVRVAVRPGTPVTTEYYPEAWRCKCRNRLYLP
ncbi:unnamed protein product [Rhodiola kirilowii]